VLFDLQSPRRRNFIRVIYAMLALLMGGGLLLFGIGGGGGGGLLDAVGLTDSGGGGGGGNPFEDQIKEAEAKLAANPQDQQALITLVTLHVQSGQQKVDVDQDTGQQSPTVESNQEFQKAADNWDAYLKTKPAKPNFAAATQVAQAYLFLAESSTSASEADANLQGAADAQKIAAEQQPTLGSLSSLAQYLYFAGDTAGADQAAQEALAKADSSNKAQLQQQLDQIKKLGASIRQQLDTAAKQEKQQAQAGAGTGSAPGSNPFQNPLGSSGALGGG